MRSTPKPMDEMDEWLDKNFPSHLRDYSIGDGYRTSGRHGKKVNGEFVGRALIQAYEWGALSDDEPLEYENDY